MADNVLIATANDVNGAHQKVVNEYLDAGGLPVSVTAATPLPVLASISTAGLATSTGQTAGNASLSSIDGKIPTGLVVTTGRLQVELPAGGTGLTNAEIRATPLPVSFTGGGDATAANQTTEISKLTSIDGKIPALGQALAAESTPIVLTAIQQAALTPPAAISGFNLEVTQLLVKAKTDNIPAQGQALAAASTPVVLTAAQIITLTPPAAITGFATAANQQTNAITDTQIRATALPVSGTFFQATQPVSGTVSTGLSQPLTDTQLRATPVPVSGTVVTGGLTDTQIRATALPISGTVAANATLAAETTKVIGTVNVAGTVPISGTVTTGGLTDTQIRATPLPISGTVSTGLTQPLTDTQIRATPLPVTMSNTLALTDTQLRASAVPISLATDADNTVTGTLAASLQTVVLNVAGKSSAMFKITNTWVGTITFEGSVDGTLWDSINAVASSTSQPQPTTTVNGSYRLTPAAFLQIRAIMNPFTSGTATISARASSATGGIFANQILPTKITDGTNTATIKAASTASLATDLPLIVALHPTSPTPNFLAAQSVLGTRPNSGSSAVGGSTHLTVGGSDGTNLRPILLDTTGRFLVGNIAELRAATLTVTATSASGVAATLTLPAVAAQFHYITSIDILIYATAARTGAATPLVVTTTNISGSPAFTFETAQAIGTNTPIQGYNLTTPLKSAAVNTATTIVAPIALTGIWRITVTYFTGA